VLRATAIAAAGLLLSPAHAGADVERHAAFLDVSLPRVMDAGGEYSARLSVRNEGSLAWSERAAVRLSYHWVEPGGRVVVRDGVRTRLAQPVTPGGVLDTCAVVRAPDAPGTYDLEWDLVQDGVTWFGVAGSPTHVERIRVRSPGSREADGRQTPGVVSLLLFFGLTTSHFLLTWFWTSRAPFASPDPDVRRLQAMVLATGSLQAVWFATTIFSSFTLTSGFVALAVLHGLGGLCSVRGARCSVQGAKCQVQGAELTTIVGSVLLVALLVQWALASTATARVAGTDAAHYHVPHAVNFANGAGPFDLIATPHLYPMGTSLAAAWAFEATGSPLLIDLATMPAFVLLVSALAALVRLTTGLPGLGWTMVLVLVLLATPLVRLSLQMSAELQYAASFLAAFALMVRRRGGDPPDPLTLAVALGLLLGSKATGVFSAATLIALHAGVLLWTRRRGRTEPSRRAGHATAWTHVRGRALAIAAGLAALVAAGGIWQVRNWVRFGSPIAPSGLNLFGAPVLEGQPYEGSMYYLSVLGDLRDTPGYDLPARLAHYVDMWLGSWYFPAASVALILGVDLVMMRSRPDQARVVRTRLAVAVSLAILTAVHAGVLAGSPWTSLEWTRGLSLRYLIPFVVAYPLVLFSCLFSEAAGWHRREGWREPIFLIATGLACFYYLGHERMAGLPPVEWYPVLRAWPSVAAAAIVGTWYLGSPPIGAAAPGDPPPGAREAHFLQSARRWSVAGTALLTLAIVVVVARAADAASRRAAAATAAAYHREAYCFDVRHPEIEDHRAISYVIDRDARRGRSTCDSRRLFLASRFDLPLDLQGPGYTNLVFDVRGRNRFDALLASRGPAPGACDYVIATRADAGTLGLGRIGSLVGAKGRLAEAGRAGRFVAYRVE
jgi:hypothetical protein